LYTAFGVTGCTIALRCVGSTSLRGASCCQNMKKNRKPRGQSLFSSGSWNNSVGLTRHLSMCSRHRAALCLSKSYSLLLFYHPPTGLLCVFRRVSQEFPVQWRHTASEDRLLFAIIRKKSRYAKGFASISGLICVSLVIASTLWVLREASSSGSELYHGVRGSSVRQNFTPLRHHSQLSQCRCGSTLRQFSTMMVKM